MSSRTVIRGGLVITASDEIHADVLIEDGRIAALAASGTPAAETLDAPSGPSTPPGSTSSPAASTPTPTWSCRSAAPSPPTPSRPAPGPPPGAVRRRSSTSPCRASASALREGLDAWHAKAEGNCAIDYGFHMIVSDVNQEHAQGDGPAGRGGRHLLQAVHGLPGRLLQRRRPDPARHAARRRERRADHDARRERHRDRRPGRAGAGRAARPTPATTARSARPCWRPRPPTAPSSSPRSPARPLYVVHVSADGGGRRAGHARATRACPSSARPARSTCSCPPTTSPSRTSRAPSTCAPRRCGPRSTRPRCGGGCAPTTSRSSPPTTAPSASRARRSWAAATSRRSPTACPASRTAWTCSTRPSSTDTSRAAAGSRSPAPTPARMFGLYPKKGTIAPGADADIVIYDPHAEQIVSAETHHMNVDYSAYEGKRITGRVETVLSRGELVIDRAGVHRTRRARRIHPALHLSVPQLGVAPMDFGLVLQTDPPASQVVSLMKRAERNGFTLRLDLRLRRALAGAVRDLQPDPVEHHEVDGRPDGHQPGHPHLGGHRLHLRHPQRHVRQPHRLRHRPRRLRDAGRRAASPTPWPGISEAMKVIRALGRGPGGRPRRHGHQVPVDQGRAPNSPSGWPRTAPRR